MMYIVGVQEHLQNILGSFVYNIDSRKFIDNGTEVAFGASDPTCSKKKKFFRTVSEHFDVLLD